MTSPEGGFYTAEDAESDGEEGKFYLWSIKEMKDILGPEEMELTISVYNVKEKGNFRERSAMEKTAGNILHMTKPLEEYASRMELPLEELEARLERARRRVLEVREDRVRPFLDDKILTGWNGLMVAALAKASRALGEAGYAEPALKAIDFIMDKLYRDGRLLRRYRDGEAAISGFIDDYAFLIWGVLELYETTSQASFLDTALELNDVALEHFWDEEDGGFYFTADDSEEVLLRRKEVYDGAKPSGNSVAALNLFRLGRITKEQMLEERASVLLRTFSEQVSASPTSHIFLLTALDLLLT
jgi:uncharacterized protein YyaL (SSP411 family)